MNSAEKKEPYGWLLWVAWATSFAAMAVTQPVGWYAGAAVWVISVILFGAALQGRSARQRLHDVRAFVLPYLLFLAGIAWVAHPVAGVLAGAAAGSFYAALLLLRSETETEVDRLIWLEGSSFGMALLAGGWIAAALVATAMENPPAISAQLVFVSVLLSLLLGLAIARRRRA